jgi:hypothetical protein
VGNGSNITLWNDTSCGDQALKGAYLILYSIAHIKDASVADHLEVFSGSHQ